MIDDLLKYAGAAMGEVDYFFCHQPNRFMLQKLADKMQLPYSKMPSNVVERFGNSSGVTIPITITLNLGDRLVHEQFRVCLAGYGVGLTWSSMLLNLGKVIFNTLIEYK
jgi:3-oxoacyl-[acyl-carrier-protein] synthase-3